jgi:hypothetical protein
LGPAEPPSEREQGGLHDTDARLLPGMYKFQAKVDSGSGNYKVGVFAK